MQYSTLTVKRVVGGKVNKFSKILIMSLVFIVQIHVSTLFLKAFNNVYECFYLQFDIPKGKEKKMGKTLLATFFLLKTN